MMLLRSFEIDFGDTGDDKGGLSNTKWFSHENGLNGRTASTTNSYHEKNSWCALIKYHQKIYTKY